MNAIDGSQDWIAAGLDALVAGGLDGVRVEVLAARLGVTKGGFYRRYRDRSALLEAMLAAWVQGRITAIQRLTDLAPGEAPQARLREVMRLFTEQPNAHGLSIELAVRQWARSDAGAATAVAGVDEVRLACVAGLYERMGYSKADARACGVMFYAVIFGQELLFLKLDAAGRDAMLEACAAVLIRPA